MSYLIMIEQKTQLKTIVFIDKIEEKRAVNTSEVGTG